MTNDANDQLRRFGRWVQTRSEGLYQPALAREVLKVSAVKADSNGNIVSVDGGLVQADGTISAAEFTVPMGGRAATVGDYLLVGHERDQAVGAELVYLGHTQSLYPGSGLVAVNANILAPSFAVTPFTTEIVKLPGSITARMSVYFNAVPQFNPSGYTVSYRVDGGEWRDRFVPHIGGVQECDLGSDLPPSVDVDVHLRTVCAWSSQQSPPSTDSTFATADDDSSPGSVTALDVSVDTPNLLIVTPTATIDAALFRGYVYEVNDAATGTADIVTVPMTGAWSAVLPPGTYYVAATPISKSGTLGGRFPATANTYQGPYTVEDQSANLDTTPPTIMGAPTLTGEVVQFGDNTWHGYLTVDLPAYSAPTDIGQYEVSIVVDDGRNWQEIIDKGDTSGRYEVGFGEFTIRVRARDQAGNAPVYGASAVETIDAPELSNTAPTVTTTSVGLGIKVSWNLIANAVGYEVQRATDGSGTGATTIGTAQARWFLDTLISASIILPTYYYRVRPIGVSNQTIINGTYSSWVAGTVLAVDGQNLRASSITANEVAADNAIFNKIVAGAILAGSYATDASPESRIEVNGNTATNPNSIRFYEKVSGVSKLRGAITGAGLALYTDAGTKDFYLERDPSNARVQFVGPAITLNYLSSVLNVGATAGRSANFKGDTRDTVVWERYLTALAENARCIYLPNGTTRGIFLHDEMSTEPGKGMYLLTHGIAVAPSGTNVADVSLLRSGSAAWTLVGALSSAYLGSFAVVAAGAAAPLYLSAYPATVYQSTALGTTGGDVQAVAAWQYLSGTQRVSARLRAYRGQNGSSLADARFRLEADYADYTNTGGALEFGWRNASSPFVGLRANGTLRQWWDDANTRWEVTGGFTISGALAKGSGTFTIPHPDPAKPDRDLRHSFVESPTRGDNLYRFAVLVGRDEADGTTEHTLPLPDYWPWLNEDGQAWCGARRHFGQMWAEVSDDGRSLTWCANTPGWYNLLLIGTRKDEVAVRGWDDTGGVEPLSRTSARD